MRILLVDDDLSILAAMSRGLKIQGIEHQAVGSVAKALPLLSWADIVISDWDMPNGGGGSILAAAGSKPVIIHSGDLSTVTHRYVAQKGSSNLLEILRQVAEENGVV